jgi:hypothetical protein
VTALQPPIDEQDRRVEGDPALGREMRREHATSPTTTIAVNEPKLRVVDRMLDGALTPCVIGGKRRTVPRVAHFIIFASMAIRAAPGAD